MDYKPTISLTFDGPYSSIQSNAISIMAANGLVGTLMAEPTWIDAAGWMTSAQMASLVLLGWEVQAYSGTYGGHNMVDAAAEYGIPTVTTHLQGIKTGLAAKGFNVSALAPNQRAWNSDLQNAMTGIYSSVRAVNNQTTLQSYPVTNVMYVNNGGMPSLCDANNTAQSLRDKVDAVIADGKWLIPVLHNIGTGTADSLSVATFTDFCQYIKSKVDAGLLRVSTFTSGLIAELSVPPVFFTPIAIIQKTATGWRPIQPQAMTADGVVNVDVGVMLT